MMNPAPTGFGRMFLKANTASANMTSICPATGSVVRPGRGCNEVAAGAPTLTAVTINDGP